MLGDERWTDRVDGEDAREIRRVEHLDAFLRVERGVVQDAGGDDRDAKWGALTDGAASGGDTCGIGEIERA